MKKSVSALSKNQLVELTIDGWSSDGSGIGRAEGMAVFVPGSAVGDRLLCRIIKVSKNYAAGRTEKLLVPSPDRIEPDCPVCARCGGCNFRHIDYAAEKALKRDRVRDAFTRIGKLDVQVGEIMTAGSPDRYRNKAVYQLGTLPDGRVCAGFYAPFSHRIVPCGDCRLQPSVFSDIVKAVLDFADRKKLSVYDETTCRGLLRRLYLRIAPSTGQILVCLVITDGQFPSSAEFVSGLTGAFPAIAGIFTDLDDSAGNAVLTPGIKKLWGADYIEDELAGRRFRISPLSFYQVNHDAAELIYGLARSYVKELGASSLLDLYCGTGTIGIACASDKVKLMGADISPDAIRDARENARLNGLNDAEYFAADADEAVSRFEKSGTSPDIVILDPPRKGCSPAVVDAASRLAGKAVIYISCDPATLARDCAAFASRGLTVRAVTPADMFPRTANVETVVLLTRLQTTAH